MISRQFAMAGGRHRRLDDAEVFRTVGVGRDDQPVAVMLDRILVADVARLDDARRIERTRRRRSGASRSSDGRARR